jgi:hypothetical protein
MTTETPPEDWVLLEAATRFTWKVLDMEELRNIYQNPRSSDGHGYRALCDMIAKHEKLPVDRKLLCAREAMKSWVGGGAGPETICVRAIELWEEGFGK